MPAEVLTLRNMRIGLLGPLELESEASIGPRDRVVLSTLVLRRGRTVTAEVVADALWPGDPPATWPKVVQGCISRLRRVLGADAIVTNPSGYLLLPERVQVDVDVFEDLVSRGQEFAREGSPERAAALLDRGLALWRGLPYPELEEWSPGRLEAARLSELHLSAQEERLAARLEAGHHVEVAAEGMVLVGEEPWRERRWAVLALAQYRTGRQVDALSSIRAARRRLGHQLGLDPGSDLVELERAILGQDPSLAADHDARQSSSLCPWRGLASYGADDRETFFGRDADVDACLARLEASPLLVLAGPSGSGKSSLMNAGVAPALRLGGRSIETFTPGPDPAASMAAARAGAAGAPILCVDQFEEAFSGRAEPAETRAWLGEIAEYALGQAPVILTVRADFLPEFALQPDFARLAERGLHLVAPLAGTALREAIEGPARVAGVRLEHGLVDLLMRDAEHQPGALPLLSHALAETWERREGTLLTVEGYRASGGISGAVAASADRLHESLSDDGRAQLRWLMLRMGSLADHGEPIRTPVPREVAASDPERARVLDLLVRSRLVTSDEGSFDLAHEALIRAWPRLRGWLEEDRAGQRLGRHLTAASAEWDDLGRPDSELYSGVRLEAALEWATRPTALPTALEQEFLDASRERGDVERAELTRQATHERHQNRRLRGLLAGAATMLVLAVVAALLAVDQSRTAANERDSARGARLLAQHESLVARSLDLRSSKRAVAALLAVEAHRSRPDALADSALLGTFTAAAGFLGYTSVPYEAIQGATVPGTSHAVVAAGTRLHLLDLETGRLGAVFEHPVESDQLLHSVVRVSGDGRRVAQLVFSPDEGGCDDERLLQDNGAGCTLLVVFDIATRKPVFGPVATPFLGGDLAINDNGRLAAVVGGFDGDLVTYDVARGRRLGRLDAPARPDGDFSVNDTGAVTFGDDSHVYVAPLAGNVRQVHARSLRVVRELPTPPAVMHSFLSLTPSGLLVGAGDRGMVAIDTTSGRRRWSIDFGSDPRSISCHSFAAAPAAGRLYCGTEFGEIHELDIADGRPTGTQLDSQLGQVGDLAVSGGNELVEFSRGYFSRWRLDGSGPISRLVAPGAMTVAGYARSGRYLHVVPRGRFHGHGILDLDTGEEVVTLEEEPRWVSWLGRDQLFVRQEARVVSVDAGSGRTSRRPPQLVSALALFPSADDSTAWAVTSYSEALYDEGHFRLQQINLTSGEHVGEDLEFQGHGEVDVEVTADGERLWVGYYQNLGSWVTGDQERNDRGSLVDLPSGTRTDLAAVWTGALSSDGRLVVGDLRGEVRELDPVTGKAIASVPGSRGGVAAVQFSADGKRLVSSGRDGRVQVHDTETWTSLGAIPSGGFSDVTVDNSWLAPPDGFVRPDGQAVAVNQRLGVVEWSLVPEEMATAACRLAGRNLTRSEWATYLGEATYRRTCPAYPAGE